VLSATRSGNWQATAAGFREIDSAEGTGCFTRSSPLRGDASRNAWRVRSQYIVSTEAPVQIMEAVPNSACAPGYRYSAAAW
jgi:hypothetical protein